jgi:hypothetical protein
MADRSRKFAELNPAAHRGSVRADERHDISLTNKKGR